jgi:hypothetical protein
MFNLSKHSAIEDNNLGIDAMTYLGVCALLPFMWNKKVFDRLKKMS